MKKFLSKIDQVIKASLPYTALLALIIGVVNTILISKAESDIEETCDRVDDVEYKVRNNNDDIMQAHNSIVRHIDDAEDNLRRNIIIWGR